MLRFVPQYRPRVWGGRRLEQELGRTLPDGPIGESWELVDLPESPSVVAGGPLAGRTLGDLWRAGSLGGSARGEFPFLLKWLDTNQRMSVQVHPDAETCRKLAKGRPKTEAWYVAHAEPKAVLWLGHYPGLDATTLRQAAAGGTIQKWLYESCPRPKDMLLVEAGTIHCVGTGFLLLEVQEPSDTTFRIYDWGREALPGERRELHLDEACLAVHFERSRVPRATRSQITGPRFTMRQLAPGAQIEGPSLRVLVAGAGPARLVGDFGEAQLQYGDVVVAQPQDGPVRLASGTCLLLTEPAQDA